MLKKPITYTDYNGLKRTEDFYFNLTKEELLTMQMGVKGGLLEVLKQALRNNDSPVIIQAYHDLIHKSYGERSADGKYFLKTKIIDGVKVQLADMFEQSPAYSELFMEMLTDDKASDEFLRGVMPADMAGELPKNLEDALPDDIKQMLPTQE